MGYTKGYLKLVNDCYIQFDHNPQSEKELFRTALTAYRGLLNINTTEKINGVEIGVLNGETSAYLLGLSERIFLVGIDPIIPDSMEANLIGSEDRIKQLTAPFKDQWQFIKQYSYNVAHMIGDDTIDFLFIDGDHTYNAVKQDYNLYKNKVKKGGLIFFHDSRMNRGGAPFHVGSSQFVDEQIANNAGLKLVGEAFSLTCFIKL